MTLNLFEELNELSGLAKAKKNFAKRKLYEFFYSNIGTYNFDRSILKM